MSDDAPQGAIFNRAVQPERERIAVNNNHEVSGRLRLCGTVNDQQVALAYVVCGYARLYAEVKGVVLQELL